MSGVQAEELVGVDRLNDSRVNDRLGLADEALGQPAFPPLHVQRTADPLSAFGEPAVKRDVTAKGLRRRNPVGFPIAATYRGRDMTRLLLLAVLVAGCSAGAPSVAPVTPTPTAVPTAKPTAVPTLDPGILVHVRLAVETLGTEADNTRAVGAWALAERDWLKANLPAHPPAGLVKYQERVAHLIDLIARREDEAALYAALAITVAARTELGL